ncbi:unnamed protein product [Linum trigynum]|uniref:Uncharacterized protein n=1 Tax=Linum trigynum TaxID=586398 RepID=A0AAV2FMY4_9ROSI
MPLGAASFSWLRCHLEIAATSRAREIETLNQFWPLEMNWRPLFLVPPWCSRGWRVVDVVMMAKEWQIRRNGRREGRRGDKEAGGLERDER